MHSYDTMLLYTYRVGFGVARFDKQAMPEPLSVGRVTRRLPRFFCIVVTLILLTFSF